MINEQQAILAEMKAQRRPVPPVPPVPPVRDFQPAPTRRAPRTPSVAQVKIVGFNMHWTDLTMFLVKFYLCSLVAMVILIPLIAVAFSVFLWVLSLVGMIVSAVPGMS